MTMTKRFLAGLAVSCLCAGSAVAADSQQAKASFLNTEGDRIGTATLTQTPNGVLIEADISRLPAGKRAFHIHETGACDPQKGFESAGGHFAPRGHQHGFAVEQGPHAGDLPNQFVSPQGKLRTELFVAGVTLEGGEASLLDGDGSALVIHSGADDYESQPAGDAGKRQACAVIEKR